MNTADGPGAGAETWTIVVPVKSLDRAKSRLAPSLSRDARRELVLAMAADVVAVCRNTPQVSAVRVVGSDPEVAQLAGILGARFVGDPGRVSTELGEPVPAEHGAVSEDPLNTALDHAMAGVQGPVGVITADLPELDARLLSRILDSAGRHRHSVVVDHLGRGTTMAFWTGPASRVCRFGVDSADRFRRLGGAVVVSVDDSHWGTAARDVDTARDLADLAGRHMGAATRRALQGVPAALLSPGAPESVTMVP